jgi:hypothetical protein
MPNDKLESITTRIIPELGYAILKRADYLPGYVKPHIEVVAIRHKDNVVDMDPDHSAKIGLRGLRALNKDPYISYCIAVVAMPPEEAWQE